MDKGLPEARTIPEALGLWLPYGILVVALWDFDGWSYGILMVGRMGF
jgi:hypothetical protein